MAKNKNDLNLDNSLNNSILLKRDTKGGYYWDIKINFLDNFKGAIKNLSLIDEDLRLTFKKTYKKKKSKKVKNDN